MTGVVLIHHHQINTDSQFSLYSCDEVFRRKSDVGKLDVLRSMTKGGLQYQK